MTIDRAKIMKDAWVIVRRFTDTKETLRSKLARALRCVWWDAKSAIRIAATAAAEVSSRIRQAMSAAQIHTAIMVIECQDSLDRNDWRNLDSLRAQLRGISV